MLVVVDGSLLLLLMPSSPRGRVSSHGPSGAGRGHRRKCKSGEGRGAGRGMVGVEGRMVDEEGRMVDVAGHGRRGRMRGLHVQLWGENAMMLV